MCRFEIKSKLFFTWVAEVKRNYTFAIAIVCNGVGVFVVMFFVIMALLNEVRRTLTWEDSVYKRGISLQRKPYYFNKIKSLSDVRKCM